ncbi:MAG TPA: hypothetical protein DIU14_01735 [Actinobacteria bacterium]|nr:hypothetical protein [Actinomycetota bacterium]
MKLKVFHDECGRESLVQQIIDTQGHCPWDGRPFNSDYNAMFVELLERAELAGTALESALDELAGMDRGAGRFWLSEDSLLGDLKDLGARLGKRTPQPVGRR